MTAPATILAIGLSLFFSANSSLHTIMKTAPSVSGEEVAAVTIPFSPNAGLSLAIDSRVVFPRIQPSSLMIFSLFLIVAISFLKSPLV